MQILRARDHKRMPWKNGGGETTEVAVFPEGAGLDDFGWRVSMARVAQDGPFSVFPGVDRTLSLLAGRAMDLDVDGRGTHRLTPHAPPLAFPADVPTAARLPDGPILDLNVMTRRDRYRHAVRRSLPFDRDTFVATSPWTLLFLLSPRVIETEQGVCAAGAHDAVVLRQGETCVVRSDDPTAVLYIVDVDRASGGGAAPDEERAAGGR
ncbi:HutD/Ves family protein [Azospirillum sp. ST 5-10]|uniref:HutD/Ves family protein n=1 Tax=unclassified Azospirillum TaxID=2630922 RepID=UPI003F49EBF2